MKRVAITLIVLMATVTVVHVLPVCSSLNPVVGTAIAQEGDGGVDPCEICMRYDMPSFCRQCEMEERFERGGCIPGMPDCDMA